MKGLTVDVLFISPAGFPPNQRLITPKIPEPSLIKVALKWLLNISNNQHL